MSFNLTSPIQLVMGRVPKTRVPSGSGHNGILGFDENFGKNWVSYHFGYFWSCQIWGKVGFLIILRFEHKMVELKFLVSPLKIQFFSKNHLFYYIRLLKNASYSKFWSSLKSMPMKNVILDVEFCPLSFQIRVGSRRAW